MDKVIVSNLIETAKLAKKVSKLLIGGEVILLSGDLGAGKTTFTKFLLAALGVKEIVSSPTFTIMKNYKAKKFDIYHFDMYRINSVDEAAEFGMEEFLYSSNTNNIIILEWADRIKKCYRQMLSKL